MSESDQPDQKSTGEGSSSESEKSKNLQDDSPTTEEGLDEESANSNMDEGETVDDENDIAEQEKEVEEIEKDIKNMAKEFEAEEQEIKEKSIAEELTITGLFIFGIVFSIIFLIFDEFLSSIRSFLEPISYTLSGILIIWILFLSYRKAKLTS